MLLRILLFSGLKFAEMDIQSTRKNEWNFESSKFEKYDKIR